MDISMLDCSDQLSVAVYWVSCRNQDPSRETVAALGKSYLCVSNLIDDLWIGFTTRKYEGAGFDFKIER